MESIDPSETTPRTTNGRALLTVEEAAQQMRLPRTALYKLISSGRLVSIKIGRHRLVPNWAVGEFIRRAVEEQGHVGRG